MRKLLLLVIMISLCYGGLGIGVKLRNDFVLSTASVRYYTPQGIGLDGQFGFNFNSGDQYQFGGAGIFPVLATKYTTFNLVGSVLFAHSEMYLGVVQAEVDLLEIGFNPEVEFSFPIKELKFELGIPMFNIGFDLENDETNVSLFMRGFQVGPIIGFHYYF